MDDKIYVREETTNRNTIVLAIIAIIFVVVGILGVGYIVLNNNNGKSTAQSPQPSPTPTPNPTPEPTTITPPTTVNPPTQVPATPPAQTPPATTFGPPADSTKINVYFHKSPETDTNPSALVPVLRDKPTTGNIVSYTFNQILTGPSSAEQAQGFKKPWSLGGSSTCGTSSYKYTYSGSTLTFNLCMDYTGTAPNEFINSLTLSLKDQGKITKVIALDKNGNCLGLAAGDNSCKT